MLGYTFNNTDLDNLSLFDFLMLRKAIPEHGVVCIKNPKLSIEALIELTKRFGETVLLPERLRFI